MRKKLKSSPRHTKQRALVFQKHWNYYIVVSEITYAKMRVVKYSYNN